MFIIIPLTFSVLQNFANSQYRLEPRILQTLTLIKVVFLPSGSNNMLVVNGPAQISILSASVSYRRVTKKSANDNSGRQNLATKQRIRYLNENVLMIFDLPIFKGAVHFSHLDVNSWGSVVSRNKDKYSLMLLSASVDDGLTKNLLLLGKRDLSNIVGVIPELLPLRSHLQKITKYNTQHERRMKRRWNIVSVNAQS